MKELAIATLVCLSITAASAADDIPTELTAETKQLLELIDGRANKKQMQAMQALAGRPDWQLAVDALMKKILETPRGEHNDECLAIMFVAMKHHEEVVLDIDPLIELLGTRSFTNQQKASQVLAILGGRVDLFEGKVRRAVRALIPLTTSQRGRVVDGALGCLNRITGAKKLGREPQKWADYFEKKYGTELDLAGSVYELLAVVRSEPGEGDAELYTLNDGPPGSIAQIKEQASALKDRAKEMKLDTKLVVVVPAAIMNTMDLDKIRDASTKVTRELVELGFGDATIAPESDVFHGPFEGGFP